MRHRSTSRLGPALGLCLGAGLAACASGCAAVATSPSWTGGGMAVSAPVRAAEEEDRIADEQRSLASQPKQVGARHILVMHAQSQRKPEGVVRTRDEAKALAQACLVKLRGGAEFDALVAECSDEPGAAARNGDLGVFERTQMVKAFADAAFALKVGQVSEVVESPYGFHIIKRTE